MFERIKKKVMSSYIMQMLLLLILAAKQAAETKNPTHYLDVLESVKQDAKERNANVALLVGSIMGIIVGGVMIYIGLFMTATVNSVMPGVNDSNYNDTKTKTGTYINIAFTLLGIVLVFSCFGLMIYSIWSMVPRQG